MCCPTLTHQANDTDCCMETDLDTFLSCNKTYKQHTKGNISPVMNDRHSMTFNQTRFKLCCYFMEWSSFLCSIPWSQSKVCVCRRRMSETCRLLQVFRIRQRYGVLCHWCTASYQQRNQIQPGLRFVMPGDTWLFQCELEGTQHLRDLCHRSCQLHNNRKLRVGKSAFWWGWLTDDAGTISTLKKRRNVTWVRNIAGLIVSGSQRSIWGLKYYFRRK